MKTKKINQQQTMLINDLHEKKTHVDYNRERNTIDKSTHRKHII